MRTTFRSLRTKSSSLGQGRVERCTLEPLETRRLLAASLQVENLDIIPGYERMIFAKVGQLDPNIPNKFKEFGNLRLKNVGDATLSLSNLKVQGPFKVVSGFPSSLAPGKSADVRVQFTATAPPPFTYNQTAGLTDQTRAGAWIGSLKFNTNDPRNGTYTEGLAGWYQSRSENNQEPSLQTAVNLIMDYPTTFGPARSTFFTQPGGKPKYYGEEVVSGYWRQADPSKQVYVRQIAAYHGQGDNVAISWHPQGSTLRKTIFAHDGRYSQTFLPPLLNSTAPAAGGFTSSGAFGFHVDGEWSDDKLNKRLQYSGGHHIRFFPARDHFGNKLANTYFLTMDYSFPGPNGRPNEDFQDNIYVITNIRPANGAVSPPVSPPPTSPPPTSPPPTSPPPTSPPPTSPPPPTGVTPKLSILPGTTTVFEGTSGTKAVNLTVSLDQASSKTISAYFTTSNAGATAGLDYVSASGQLVFSPGQLSKTVTVQVKGDTVGEGDEAFNVNLYGASNATIAAATAKVIIKNGAGTSPSVPPTSPPPTSPPPTSPPPTSPPPSGLPRVTIVPTVSVVEGDSGTKAVTFAVTIDRNPPSTVKFYYTTANGGAQAGVDYNATSGQLAFYTNGDRTKLITVYVRGDTGGESNEDFFVRLYGIQNGVLGSTSSKGTIVNDD